MKQSFYYRYTNGYAIFTKYGIDREDNDSVYVKIWLKTPANQSDYPALWASNWQFNQPMDPTLGPEHLLPYWSIRLPDGYGFSMAWRDVSPGDNFEI